MGTLNDLPKTMELARGRDGIRTASLTPESVFLTTALCCLSDGETEGQGLINSLSSLPKATHLANVMESEPKQSASRSLALTGKPSTMTLPHPTVTWYLLESVGKRTGVPEDTFLREDTSPGPRASALAGQTGATGVLSLQGPRGPGHLSTVGLTSAEEWPRVSQALFSLRHISSSLAPLPSPETSHPYVSVPVCMYTHTQSYLVDQGK